MNIVPVVLCGGSGSRLWPLSRENMPKQFLPNLAGDESLFKQTINRCSFNTQKPVIITNNKYRFLISLQLRESIISDADIIIEPSQKNTAPAILAAAVNLVEQDKDGLMLVMPSDHFIPDYNTFHETTIKAAQSIKDGQIICFGISATYPETGYGYIKTKHADNGIMPVRQFIEKPNLDTAMSFIEDGNYFWNAGIFLFRASEIIKLAELYEPEMLAHVVKAVRNMTSDLGFNRLDESHWEKIVGNSFDYAFMEKVPNIACVAFDGEWSDLGDWNSVSKLKVQDHQGNVTYKSATAIDCKNTILWSEKECQTITGLGLDNILAVSTGDAIIVADRSQIQNVKHLVDELKKNELKQATEHSFEYRPWGWFESVATSASHKVKILNVLPGHKLSLQYHHYRAENWVVTKGQATVMLDGVEHTLNESESIFIKTGAQHQLINNTKENLEIIEVQTGSYFGEDDIIRIEDYYNRK